MEHATPFGALLAELESLGEHHDRSVTTPDERLRNITRDTGEFLAVLVRATGARRILEIGTSNGYSTLWLAEAARALGGRVTTVEWAAGRWSMAGEHFARAGLADVIESLHAEAGRVLDREAPASRDLVFLDADRERYVDWWPVVRETLAPGGLLVVDNATSHADELAPFIDLVEADDDFTTSLVPVGKGEFLATRTPASATA
ncbi:O-methyltransferase [Halomonas halophila]|uniref:O-methyltransferase n=3 Tax=Halomonadaceae TaxID=28256 RepID=A0ABQ0U5L3_9GAMM|nr:O-methyltransferase [Halomonas salina]KGE78036.1 methyltransferase [Halomonas salina]RAH39549.1 O-methyltransferase [Halomonas sp. SL1]GEK73822.1 O-methyltransferase [Halomonas halophila]